MLWESDAMDEGYLDEDDARGWEDLDVDGGEFSQRGGFPDSGPRRKGLDARRRIERQRERRELQFRLLDVFDEPGPPRSKVRRRRRFGHWLS